MLFSEWGLKKSVRPDRGKPLNDREELLVHAASWMELEEIT